MSITMLAVLFLFQFSNISVLYTSRATINHAAKKPVKITAPSSIQAENLEDTFDYSTAIIGSESNFEANLAAEWCLYQKRSYARFDDLQEFYTNISTNCKLLIVNSIVIDTADDISVLEQACDWKVHIVLTSIPDTELIKRSKKLRNLLGIHSIKSDTFKTNGTTLFEGFLLGGKTSYKKLKMMIPYFKLKSGIKTYIVGDVKNQEKKKIKNEDLPPILWRYHTGKNFVFVVNADFFSDHTGIGMLTAMLSEMDDYLIYPIINAQSVICQNYPYLSNENTDKISEKYYYETQSLSQNVLWPDTVSILSATDEKFTGMIAPKFEYSNTFEGISSNTISFYYKQAEQISGELGLSGDQMEGSSFYETKIKYDTKIFKQKVPSYIFTIFSPGKMPESIYEPYLNGKKDSILANIRTLVIGKENQEKPLLSFYNENILSMANTINGFTHKDEEDLYLRSVETALGYCSTYLDFSQVYYPTADSTDWTRLSKNLSRFLQTYWAEFRKGFRHTTVSEADTSARRFLALNYTTHRQDDTINLSISHFQKKASFIIRLSNEKITELSGGSYKEMEDNIYVINASSKNVIITVTDNAK